MHMKLEDEFVMHNREPARGVQFCTPDFSSGCWNF